MKRISRIYPTQPDRGTGSRRCKGDTCRGIGGRLRRFGRDEDGALIIFGIFIFGLMLAIGGLSFDLMRYDANRTRLQATVDRASLAAASLTQSLDPEDVVDDYFAKAHMTEFLDKVTVTEGLGSRRVEVEASLALPLHHGNFGVFRDNTKPNENDILLVEANSIAEEVIDNVEISLVLDVSGSMGSKNRLTNLKTAAKAFLDTIYAASDADKISTSIVPYAMQVNAGANLLSYYTRDNTHERSHCINFATSDFSSTALSTETPLEQTLHFDPYTNENNSFQLEDSLPRPACRTNASRQIMPWSTDKAAMKTFIDSFFAAGNTSTDIGAKWGVALLDPGSRDILTGMIASSHVDAAMAGRPLDYDATDAMKVLVVMTDGAHTNQYYMGDYRDGNSFVWRWVNSSGRVYYSIWHGGEDSTPITNPSGKHWYCDDWNHGSCNDWEKGKNPKFWYVANRDGGGDPTYEWRKEPRGGNSATRMTWQELWDEIPPEFFSDEMLYSMKSLTHNKRNAFENAIDSKGRSTKDTRLSNLCTKAKEAGIIIFTVGLEVTSSNATKLQNCASSPNHAFDVDGLDITNAFQSIASQINQLRLLQ